MNPWYHLNSGKARTLDPVTAGAGAPYLLSGAQLLGDLPPPADGISHHTMPL